MRHFRVVLAKALLAAAIEEEHEPPFAAMFEYVGFVRSFTVEGNVFEIAGATTVPEVGAR